MEEKTSRTKWLHLRLTEAEYERLLTAFKQTTERKLSQYARKIFLGKPVVAAYRNQSMDDFMAELIRLRGDLKDIGNNFNQLVKRLHTFQSAPSIAAALSGWEQDRIRLAEQVNNIQSFITQQAKSW